MDKASMRARMKEAAKKKEKRINSPLVRYNELDQAVCKVCNVVIKSETLWVPHLASRSHKQAAEQIKARAANSTQEVAKVEILSHSVAPPQAEPNLRASGLPADFFNSSNAPSGKLPTDFFDASSAPSSKRTRTSETGHTSTPTAPPIIEPTRSKPQNGSAGPGKPLLAGGENVSKVPEGFFDNVDADHRARGLEPPKLDIKEEYKEFQKIIKEDLVELDVREEEEEFEAAEEREGFEEIEQRTIADRIDLLRKLREERVAKAKSQQAAAFPAAMGNDDDDSEDEDDDDDDANYIDWRAKEI